MELASRYIVPAVAPSSDPATKTWVRALVSVLAILLVIRVYIILNYNVNWDEFYYLSFVHNYARGELATVLQSFHVHFFAWLTDLSTNEVDQIVAARGVMLALQFATAYLLFRIGRRFFSTPAALFAVLSYVSFSYVIRQGTSFRTDPIVTFLLIASLELILARTETIVRPVIAGALTAVAVVITIKSVFYLPILAGVLLSRAVCSGNYRREIKRGTAMATAAIASSAILYILHKSGLDLGQASSTGNILAHSYDKTIGSTNLFPGWDYLRRTFLSDFVFWGAFGFGLTNVIKAARRAKGKSRIDPLILLMMIFPLLTLIFYRNTFPYYYTFILAPACLLCGVAWDNLTWQHKPKLAASIARIMIAVLAASNIAVGIVNPTQNSLASQRTMLAVIHKAFPQPVPYIDRGSMVASFPSYGFFMSSWGMENYHSANIPVLQQTIEENQPKFLLANIAYLDVAAPAYDTMIKPGYGLLDADVNALRSNYIPHWGKLYVAGKRLNLGRNKPNATFTIRIEGIYTLESINAVVIDKQHVAPGQTIFLSHGTHKISATDNPGQFVLRWGENLYRPDDAPSTKPLFTGF